MAAEMWTGAVIDGVAGGDYSDCGDLPEPRNSLTGRHVRSHVSVSGHQFADETEYVSFIAVCVLLLERDFDVVWSAHSRLRICSTTTTSRPELRTREVSDGVSEEIFEIKVS
jgi:hypothetical protein